MWSVSEEQLCANSSTFFNCCRLKIYSKCQPIGLNGIVRRMRIIDQKSPCKICCFSLVIILNDFFTLAQASCQCCLYVATYNMRIFFNRGSPHFYFHQLNTSNDVVESKMKHIGRKSLQFSFTLSELSLVKFAINTRCKCCVSPQPVAIHMLCSSQMDLQIFSVVYSNMPQFLLLL